MTFLPKFKTTKGYNPRTNDYRRPSFPGLRYLQNKLPSKKQRGVLLTNWGRLILTSKLQNLHKLYSLLIKQALKAWLIRETRETNRSCCRTPKWQRNSRCCSRFRNKREQGTLCRKTKTTKRQLPSWLIMITSCYPRRNYNQAVRCHATCQAYQINKVAANF
jgi:hypothetical protein